MKKVYSLIATLFLLSLASVFAEDVASVKEPELIITPTPVVVQEKEKVEELKPVVAKETAVVQKLLESKGTKTYMLRYRDTRAAKDAFVSFNNRRDMYEYIQDHNLRKNPNIISYKIVITKTYTDRKILFIEEKK